MRTGIVVQARMGSTRFPGKVTADLNGRPVLQHVLERCRRIPVDGVILAVPDEEQSWPLIQIAENMGIDFVAGSENDVISRFLKAANQYDIDLIMRITADCPLLNANLCRNTLALTDDNICSYAAIDWPRGGFPRGYGCEVFSKFTLQLANELAVDQYDREHVTPWMQRNVRCKYLENDKDESRLNYCIDTPEDLKRLQGLLDKGEQIR